MTKGSWLAVASGLWMAGCAVQGTVPGHVAVIPPAVIVQPPAYHWHWAAWPHVDVEHHYVVEHEHVYRVDHHYYPFYDSFHPCRECDHGKHRGWFKHHEHHHDDDD